MKTRIFYYLLMAICIGSTNTSCSPEDGRDGADGLQGEQGEQGDPGTANVIYSDWMPIVWNDVDGPLNKSMMIDEPGITKDFIETGGTVLMFLKQEVMTTVIVYPLPFQNGNDLLHYFYANAPDEPFEGILLMVKSMDNASPIASVYTEPKVSIRYVLIPGGNPLGDPAQAIWEELDKTDYQKVAAFLGIEE